MTFLKVLKPVSISLFAIGIIFAGYKLIPVISDNFDSPLISPLGKLMKGHETSNTSQINSSSQKEVFGFLPYWMLKNHKYLRYDLLTTIAYFGLHIDGQGEFIKIHEDGNSELGWLNWKTNEALKQVIDEAKRNNVRFALTIAAQDNGTIEEFLNCPSCWDTLITNTITELKTNNISDLNLDFEYRGFPEQKLREQYTNFVKSVTEAVHKAIEGSQVSVDTYADAAYKTKLHDVGALAKAADILFIMAYDFHRLTSDKTGPIAPLGGAPDKYKYDLTLMLEDYLRFVKSEKLIMGVAYYGYDWITEDEKFGSIRIPGNETRGYSKISYYGICEYHKENKGDQRHWDKDAQAPWFHYYDEEHGVYRHCHYENEHSLAAKYKFIKTNNLRGVGIWALGYDGNYPELWKLLERAFY